MTISCARCHDHKFDPLSQKDYYALAGIFYSSHMFTFQGSARLRRRLEQPLVSDEAAGHEWRVRKSVLDGLEAAVKSLDKTLGKTRELDRVRRELKTLSRRLASESDAKLKVQLQKSIAGLEAKQATLLAEQKKNGWTFDVAELHRRDALVAERDRLAPLVSAVVSRMVMREGPVPGTRHKHIGDVAVLLRGNHLAPGPIVGRGFPEVFAGVADRREPLSGSGRLELARWLTRPDHPLTARVMVNRIWQHLVGVGIVETPSNFGRLGRPPTHPEVLDWLAVEFVESGWSVKSLVRRVMISSVYRQTSLASQPAQRLDPRNRWLGRMNRKRLDAECLKLFDDDVTLEQSEGDDRSRVARLYRELLGRLPTAEDLRLASRTLSESREVRRRLVESGSKTAGGVDGPWQDLCMALLCSNEFLYVD